MQRYLSMIGEQVLTATMYTDQIADDFFANGTVEMDVVNNDLYEQGIKTIRHY